MTRRSIIAMTLCLAIQGCNSCESVEVSTCELDTDCLEGEECNQGRCAPKHAAACTEDLQCGTNNVCVQGVCQPRYNRADGGVTPFDAGSSSSSGQPGMGVINLTPNDVVDFGSPLPDTDIQKSVLVRNDGQGPLNILSVGRTTGTSAEFTVTPSVPLPKALAIAEEMLITIVYRLADGDADVGSITVGSDAMDCSFTCTDPQNVRVALFSEFKGVRNLELTPSLHDFGFVEQGESSQPFAFTARNDGTQTKILTIQSVTLTGADSVHFSLPSTFVIPAYLYPGQTLELPVTYSPAAMATHSAELVVRANSDNPDLSELRATVTGRSVPTIDISADPIDFGHLELGQESTRVTTIHNNSNVAVSINSGTFANGAGVQGFYLPVPSPFPINITAGNTATLDVIFRPTGAAGARSDTLNLSHSLSATPVYVALSGIADPPPPPPGGPKLAIAMDFTRDGADQNGCNASSNYNWQNMDLILEGGGGICEKARQGEIGGRCQNDAFCTCDFGSQGGGTWRASGGTPPEPYTQELISHNEQGGDGNFFVKNRYWDDCSDDWAEGSAAIIQGICGYGGTPPMRYMCFPRDRFPLLYNSCSMQGEPYNGYCINETTCLNAAPMMAGGSCDGHAPSTAKTVITIRSAAGAIVEQRAFCKRFEGADQMSADTVATLIREQGYFRIDQLGAGVTEVSVSASCPQ